MIKLKDLISECWECERDREGRDFTHGEDGNAPMADGELRSIASNASKLINMVHPEDQLPAWALAKITIASDNLASVARYIGEEEAEMQEPGPGYSMMEVIGGRTFTYKDARGKEKYMTASNPDEAKEKVRKFGGDVSSVKEKSAPLPAAPKKFYQEGNTSENNSDLVDDFLKNANIKLGMYTGGLTDPLEIIKAKAAIVTKIANEYLSGKINADTIKRNQQSKKNNDDFLKYQQPKIDRDMEDSATMDEIYKENKKGHWIQKVRK